MSAGITGQEGLDGSKERVAEEGEEAEEASRSCKIAARPRDIVKDLPMVAVLLLLLLLLTGVDEDCGGVMATG